MSSQETSCLEADHQRPLDIGSHQGWLCSPLHRESPNPNQGLVGLRLNQAKDSSRHEETTNRTCGRASDQAGHRAGQRQALPWPLQSDVSCSQEERETSTHHRSDSSQRLSCLPEVQDGILHLSGCVSPTQGLGDVARSQGRLLSRSDCSSLPQISSDSRERPGLPVPSTSLRPVDVPLGIHQDAGATGSSSPLQRSCSSSLPGRLSHQESVQVPLSGVDRLHSVSPLLSRLGCQPREVRSRSVSGVHLHRSSVQHPSGVDVSSSRQGGQHRQSRSSSPRDDSSGPRLGIISRSDLVSRATSPFREDPDTSHSTMSETSVFLGSSSRKQDCASGPTCSKSHSVVDRSCQSQEGRASRAIQTGHDTIHGCLQNRLGCPCPQLPDLRLLESSGETVLHQCAGTSRCLESSSTSSRLLEVQEGHGGIRQLNSCCLHKQAGRNRISEMPGCQLPASGSGRKSGNVPQGVLHPGTPEPSCRSPLSSERHCGNRVDHGLPSCQPDIPTLGETTHRSDGDSSQLPDRDLRQSEPRSSGLRLRRNVLVLGQSGRVHISTLADDNGSPDKDSSSSVPDNSNSSSLAQQGVVSTSSTSTDRLPKTSTASTRHHRDASQRNVSSNDSFSGSSRMSTIVGSKVKRGFSREVSKRVACGGRGDSTHRLYDSKWDAFSLWCMQRDYDPVTLPLAKVADFFVHLFNDGLAPVTIEGYRSAIDSVWLPTSGRTMAGDDNIRQLIANFKMERPRAVIHVPKWDLSLVLRYLRSRPEFHPRNIGGCHLYFAQKTVFLALLAAGRRCQDIHALDPRRISISTNAVIIPPFPAYLPKVRSTAEGQERYEPIAFKKLSTFTSDKEDLLLCPAQTLLYYDKWARKRAPKRHRFFVSNRHDAKPVVLNTMSSWVKKVIRAAYSHAEGDTDALAMAQARPHEVRAVAASLALQSTFALTDIIGAAQWSTPSVFAAFYLRDVSSLDGKLHTIGPLIVAGKRI